MARTWEWLRSIRRSFAKSSCKSVAVLDDTNLIHNDPIVEEKAVAVAATRYCCNQKELTIEELAAIKIQACFRGHLARRAFRALRSLVKLQALVRGVSVRRQARIAVHCMQAMVRLQVRIRARQLLNSSGDTGSII